MSDNLSYYYEMAKAIAALSYQGVYILDIDTNKYVYISDNPILRCSVEEMEKGRVDARSRLDNVPDEDALQLVEACKSIKHFVRGIPMEKKKNLNIYLNYHRMFKGRTMMVCDKLQMLDFDAEGMPHFVLGLVSYSIHGNGTLFIMSIRGEDYYHRYNFERKCWEPVKRVNLSNDERDMLRLTMQGYTMEQIGKIMFKSMETIKFYRRQVFLKMNVKNISEAIAYATHYCLI